MSSYLVPLCASIPTCCSFEILLTVHYSASSALAVSTSLVIFGKHQYRIPWISLYNCYCNISSSTYNGIWWDATLYKNMRIKHSAVKIQVLTWACFLVHIQHISLMTHTKVRVAIFDTNVLAVMFLGTCIWTWKETLAQLQSTANVLGEAYDWPKLIK